jgi:two-component system OmpR family sensor kinase
MNTSTNTGTHSLRQRLLVSVMTAILLAALFQAVSAYRGALQQADEMFDYHLQQMAYSLRGGPALAVPGLDGEGNPDTDYVIQIWGPDGVPLFRSTQRAMPPRAVLGFSDVNVNGLPFRVYTVQTPYQTIQIAQDMSARTARARALAVRAMLPMTLIGPLLMLILWWVIRHSLAPLERTRQQVATREASDLSPLNESDLPDEVRPLVQELNLLFDRVHAAFEAQKSFVANAAHELRSPLTALKLQAQALARLTDSATDEGTRQIAIERLNQGIDRAVQLMNQLLVLARQEAAGESNPTWQSVDLQALVRTAVTEHLPQALGRGIDLGVSTAETAMVQGDPDALLILLRNLLDNALKYTPGGGRVDVGLVANGNSATLNVDDSGPGIAPAERERVFERFYRSPNVTASGSGLGLAIARAIANRHQATFQLDQSPELGGLRIQVRFKTRLS